MAGSDVQDGQADGTLALRHENGGIEQAAPTPQLAEDLLIAGGKPREAQAAAALGLSALSKMLLRAPYRQGGGCFAEPTAAMQEALLPSTALEAKLTGMEDAALQGEVAGLRLWCSCATSRVKKLERRAAWLLLGLEEGEAGSEEVHRAFKRQALLLHPDKGGDAKRFQLLQEMRQVLAPKEDAESSSDEEPVKAPEKGKVADEAVSDERMKLEQERRKLQQEVAGVWDRSQQLAAELGTPSAPSSCSIGGDQAVLLLRNFAARVMPVELALLEPGNENRALGVIENFLRDGGEILLAASLMSPSSAVGAVALEVTAPLLSRVDSPAVKERCSELLQAIQHASTLLEDQLAEATAVCQEAARSSSVETPSELPCSAETQLWRLDEVHQCAGAKRDDGSAVYCLACDCWVPLSKPFDLRGFREHCDTDFMHRMVVGAQ